MIKIEKVSDTEISINDKLYLIAKLNSIELSCSEYRAVKNFLEKNILFMKKLTEDQKRQIKSIIADITMKNIDEINDEDYFVDNLGFDSIESAELIMEIEELFNCSIKFDEIQHLNTVSDVYTLVANALNKS